ncbi:MAG: zinc ABC transporter substrate-binding protein [Ardenticatenales bacterium]|nr:zinc ABC transporter substrate-binding protein [Ardenticatenales bacterium]
MKDGILLLFVLLILVACGQESPPAENNAAQGATSGGGLRIVATTTIIGAVVQQVAGEQATVTVLMPVGSDPHAFQPRPQDIAAVADADVVFINGLGLESFLEPMLENAGGAARVIALSDQIVALEAEGEEEEGHEHEGQNPHVWLDPNNVILWTEQIEKTLGELDPAQAASYTTNAEVYQLELQELDAWIAEQVRTIPEERRQLVTDHEIFGYFAARYGFEQVGAVIPSLSTMAEPSAQEMAALQDAVRQQEVSAIFMSTTVSQGLVNSVAADTGTQLITLYTDSLSGLNGPAATYVDLMRYNVTAIVDALR